MQNLLKISKRAKMFDLYAFPIYRMNLMHESKNRYIFMKKLRFKREGKNFKIGHMLRMSAYPKFSLSPYYFNKFVFNAKKKWIRLMENYGEFIDPIFEISKGD